MKTSLNKATSVLSNSELDESKHESFPISLSQAVLPKFVTLNKTYFPLNSKLNG